jgi:hypothetical protein
MMLADGYLAMALAGARAGGTAGQHHICLSLAIAMIVRARLSGEARRPPLPGMPTDLPGAEPEGDPASRPGRLQRCAGQHR